MGLPWSSFSHLSPIRMGAGLFFPSHSHPKKNLKQNVLCQDCPPVARAALAPRSQMYLRPASNALLAQQSSEQSLVSAAPVRRFRPLLCLGTLTLPPSSLVQELPQLEWLDLVPELVASSDLSSSGTPVTHP